MNLINTKIKIAKMYEDKIEEIIKESDGLWAYTEAGYMFADMDSHTAHEMNQTDLKKVIQSIVPCECSECEHIKKMEETEMTEEIKTIETPEETGFSMKVVPAGKKFKYINAQGEIARRSDNGEYTHVVYAKNKERNGEWFEMSFHSRKDLADKKASALDAPDNPNRTWERARFETKVIAITKG